MANNADIASMALFCDFENIALGVRDAQYDKFDIRPVLERLLAKGSIVVKKAYCDWERYKGFKAAMHEANFELIEIPHVRQSGKNSADIRMVVDALDLCYTKAHVDTFVIISGDSDFSPLVSKLRENAKRVIGVGVKQSCSDLLVTNCDEFIYYDDLLRDREARRPGQRREREPGKRSPEDEAGKAKAEERKSKAVDIVAATFADLMADRGESERIWASVLKEVVKRRNPGFSESYYGFRSFGNLLEEAAQRGLLGFGRDEKGAFVTRVQARPAAPEAEAPAPLEPPVVETASEDAPAPAPETTAAPSAHRRGGRRTRKDGERQEKTAPTDNDAAPEQPPTPAPMEPELVAIPTGATAPVSSRSRGGRRRGRPDKADQTAAPTTISTVTASVETASADAVSAETPAAALVRTPRKAAAVATPGKEKKKVAGKGKEKVADKGTDETAPVASEAAPATRKPRAPRSRKAKAADE